MATLPCPFVYAKGAECTGRIIAVEAYEADIEWRERAEGEWSFEWQPRSHYHLFCSERGNHAGYKKTDDERMKFSYERLPDEVRALIDGTRQVTPAG
ncbi:MAG: hypothetical protein M3P30_09505 [Chloroflexota bacterium]|nr:hypothetical protein [Chloroflexota bacterium]